MTSAIRVLHVDDDPAFADLTATFLERVDDRFTVESVTDADAALDRLDAGGIDCIVSNYEMPGGSGIAFLGAVRDQYGDLPFVLFTGRGSESVASEAIAAGVTDYIQKGSGTERYEMLAHRISNAVAAHRTHTESERHRQRLDGILKTVPGCVVQVDRDGQFVFANDRAKAVLRLQRSVVTDYRFDDPEWQIRDLNGDPIPSEDLPFARIRETGEPVYDYRHTIQWSDGTEKVLHVNGAPVVDATGEVESIVFSLIDITDQREREQALERTKRRLDGILEHTTTPMFLKDTDGTYLLVNRGYTNLFGLAESTVVGATDHDLHPEAMATAARANDRWVLEHAEPLTVEEGIVVDGEERIFLSSKVPIYDDDDQPTAVFGVAKDITDREAERAKLERQNEVLTEFTGVVSHDLRNPLTVVKGRIELARDECDSPHLDDASDSLNRCLTLIDDLLALARGGDDAHEVEPISLTAAATDCWEHIETEGATLAVETERTVRADRSRLEQLLQNLLENSVEHGRSKTERDSATAHEAPTQLTVTVGETPDGGGFYVADDGPGVPASVRNRLFEPGYSTGETNAGLGMGIVARAATDHGWTVTVAESEAGGARFEVRGVEWA